MAKLYDNTGIATPQIAPLAMDQKWGDSLPWHVTSGETHWVYSTHEEAIAHYLCLRDEREKFLFEQAQAIGVQESLQLPHPELPCIYQHTMELQQLYISRERALAERVCTEAQKLFNDSDIRRSFGGEWDTWHDCISRGLDRICKYFPDLISV